MASTIFKGTASAISTIFPWRSCDFRGNISIAQCDIDISLEVTWPCLNRFFTDWKSTRSGSTSFSFDACPRFDARFDLGLDSIILQTRVLSANYQWHHVRLPWNIVLLQCLPLLWCSLWPRLWLHYTANMCSQRKLSMTSCTVAMVQASHTMPTWDVLHEYIPGRHGVTTTYITLPTTW